MVNFGYSNNFGTGAFNNRFKNPYNFSAGRVDSDTSNAIFDAIKRRQQMEIELEEERSLLDRTFDTLLLPNYVIAGTVDGMFSKDRTVADGFLGGFKAGTPWGDGYEAGETTFSDVLETMGWKPESGLGKFAKGTVGFGLDVLLDPTTYLTGGLSALVRGSGRVGQANKTLDKLAQILPESLTGGESITHMTKEMAEYIVKGSNKAPTDVAQLAKDSENLANKYNKLIGIRDVGGGKPITFGLENLPFGEKFFKGNKITLSDGNSVRNFADKVGTAYGYSRIRDAFYGSRMGHALSNNAPLKHLAETKPEELYDFMKSIDITKGKKISKIEKDKLIREKAKTLMNLTPAQNAELIRLLEDKETFAKIKDTLLFSETSKGRDIAKVLDGIRKQNDTSIKDVEQVKKLLFGLEQNKNLTQEERNVLKTLQDQINKKIVKSDVKHAESTKERVARISKLKADRDALKSKPVMNESKVVDPTPDVGAFKQLYDDAINERQSWQGEREMGAVMRQNGVSDKGLRENGTKVESERKLREEMSKYIYGSTGKLASDFRMSNMDGIIKLMDNAENPEALGKLLESGESIFGTLSHKEISDLIDKIHYGELSSVLRKQIDDNPAMYSEHAGEVYRYLAKKHGYKDFEEEVRNPIFELKKKGKLKASEKSRLASLEKKADARNADFDKYFKQSTREGFLDKVREEEYQELYESFHRMLLEPDEVARRGRFIQEDTALDWVGGSRKTGEFDDITPLDDKIRFTKDEVDMMKKSVFNVRVKKLQTVRDPKTGAKKHFRNQAYKIKASDMRFIATHEQMIQQALKKMFPQSKYSELTTNQRNILMRVSSAMTHAELKNSKGADDIMNNVMKASLQKLMKKAEVERLDSIMKQVDVGKRVSFKEGDEIVDGVVTGKISNKVEKTRTETSVENKSVPYVDGKGNNKLRAERVSTSKDVKYMEADGTYSLNVKKADGSEVTVKFSDVQGVKNAEDVPFEKVAEETEMIRMSDERMKDTAEELARIEAEIKREKKNMSKATSSYGKRRRTLVDELNTRASMHIKRIEDLEQTSKDAEVLFKDIVGRVSTDANVDLNDLDNIVDAISKSQKEIEDALLTDEALMDYVSRNMSHEVVEEALYDANVRQSKLIALSERASSKEMVHMVKWVREDLINAGAKEVEINKLSKEAFVEMMDRYVPRIPTKDGERYFNSMKELKEHGTFITQDFGYGQKWNPYAKGRTIKGENIAEINKYFAKEKGIEKVFKDNMAEIYLDRMLKHNELVYDNQYMKTMMDDFGYEIKDGVINEGYRAVANYGQVKETIHTIAKSEMKAKVREYRKANNFSGDLSDETMKRLYEEAVDDALGYLHFSRESLDANATPMLELTSKQMEVLVPMGIAKQVNGAIVNKANQTRMLAIAKDESRALQLYDKFLHFMKLQQTVIMPAFHVRNDMSNAYQNWLGVGRDAFDVKFNRDALKASLAINDMEKLKKLRPIITDDGQRVYHWDEIVDLSLKHGGIDEGYFAQDIGAGAITSGLFKNKIKPSWNPTDTANFKPYRLGTKVGSTIENKGRLLHIASLLKQGRTIEEAVESSTKYLFDYSDLTMFEKSTMKRIFPYYTWMRKNARLQVGEVIDQPQKYALTAKAMNGIEGMVNKEDQVEDKYMSDFARDWIQTPFSFGGKASVNADGETSVSPKQPLMLSPNLPFMDLARIPDPTQPLDSLRELFAQTAPAIKLPVELATNKNMFFDSEIAKVGEDGKQQNPISSRLAHIASQFAPVGAVQGGVDKSGGDRALSLLSTLGGVKMTAYDYEASKRRTIEEHYEDLYKYTIMDKIEDGAVAMISDMGVGIKDGIVRLAGDRPLQKGQYKGALSPISRTTYEKLSDADKKLYTPPTEKDATAYHKRAEELSAQAYEETGMLKKFIWATFDTDSMANERVVNVKKVTDGDTFTIDLDGEMVDIRLLLVDTPESAGRYEDNPMPFGKEASNYSKQMLFNKDVRIYMDGKDKYGRTLAYVELDDKDFNEELLRQGLGQVRYLFGNTSDKVGKYYDAENEAFKAKKGIWSMDGYATPNDDTGFNLNK